MLFWGTICHFLRTPSSSVIWLTGFYCKSFIRDIPDPTKYVVRANCLANGRPSLNQNNYILTISYCGAALSWTSSAISQNYLSLVWFSFHFKSCNGWISSSFRRLGNAEIAGWIGGWTNSFSPWKYYKRSQKNGLTWDRPTDIIKREEFMAQSQASTEV